MWIWANLFNTREHEQLRCSVLRYCKRLSSFPTSLTLTASMHTPIIRTDVERAGHFTTKDVNYVVLFYPHLPSFKFTQGGEKFLG